MDLQEIKSFCRVDCDDDDTLLLTLQQTAIQYLQESANIKYDSNNKLHNMFVKLLVVYWYENRLATEGNTMEIPFSLSCILNHIAIHEGMRQ